MELSSHGKTGRIDTKPLCVIGTPIVGDLLGFASDSWGSKPPGSQKTRLVLFYNSLDGFLDDDIYRYMKKEGGPSS
jgi:hypothetical protein